MSAKRSGGADNLCQVIDDHAGLIDVSVKNVEIPSNGNLLLTKTDNSTTTNTIARFPDFVISGMQVTQQSAPDALTFDVAVGTFQIDANLYQLTSAASVTLNDGDATDPRFDVIYIDSTSTVQVEEGVPAAAPAIPNIGANDLELAVVYVSAGATGAGGASTGTPSGITPGTTIGNTLFWNGTQWIENTVVQIFPANGRVELQNSTASGLNSMSAGSSSSSGELGNSWGNSCTASGNTSTAWGFGTTASAISATAFGDSTVASGPRSTVWGIQNEATAAFSTAWGQDNVALGNYSTVFGLDSESGSYCETTIGSFATKYTVTDTSAFSNVDRVLTVGNGTSDIARSDTTRIWKSGYHQFVGTINITETTAGAGAIPSAGDIRYNTSTNKHEGYDGSSWNAMY